MPYMNFYKYVDEAKWGNVSQKVCSSMTKRKIISPGESVAFEKTQLITFYMEYDIITHLFRLYFENYTHIVHILCS